MKYGIRLSFAAIVVAASAVAAKPPSPKPQANGEKPLTYANVISFFKSTHLRATEVQPRCTVFFEGEWKNANVYDYCLIIAENSDRDIQVTFYLTDAHEMNWVTEFIDSPFFTMSEKRKLFGLLNRNRGTRGEKVGRFRVDVNHWQPRHAEIIVFSFTPLGKSSG
jgi:hypothetical protein